MTDARDPSPESRDPDANGSGTPDPADPSPAEDLRGTHERMGYRPGASRFTIEGRAAPGLFVVGWLGSLLGFGIAIVAAFSDGGFAAGILFLVGLAVLSVGLVAAAGSQAIERRARGRTDYAGPSPVLAFLASLPITILAIIVLGTPLVWLGLDPGGPLATLINIAIVAAVYVLVIRLLVVGTGALTWSQMGIVRPSTGVVREIGWGAALAVPVLVATGFVGALLAQFLERPPDVLPPAPDTGALLLNLLAAAVVAPIGEETFFRGFTTTAWLRTNGPAAAIIRGALFFAAAHILTVTASDASQGIEFALFAFAARLPVALALGWLFVRTRSIYGPVALHATFNGLLVWAVFVATQG